MKQYLCSRYPVDKKNGGVSRAWLLEQCHTAKYPNLLMEIALHPAPPAYIALQCGISEDVLIDILLGKDDFIVAEAMKLRNVLQTDVGFPVYDFIFSNSLAPYEETEDGNGLKEARQDAKKLKFKHPAVPLIKRLLLEDVPPAVAVMALDAFDDYQKPEHERRVQITPRTQTAETWDSI